MNDQVFIHRSSPTVEPESRCDSDGHHRIAYSQWHRLCSRRRPSTSCSVASVYGLLITVHYLPRVAQHNIHITLIPNIDCADSVSIIEGEASHIEFSSITITGLVGSETATNSELPLGGAGADIFGRNGSWDQISGTLMLANPWRGPVVRTAVALAVYSCLRRVCKHRLART